MSMKLVGVAMAAAIVGATPALAQDGMQSGAGANGGMTSMSNTSTMSDASSMPKMSASQTAAMQKCQAMSSDMMMKNKKCARMAKKYPSMMNGGTTSNM